MTNSMTKDNTRQKSIRLYPPVQRAIGDVPNFNYWVNKILGEALGISPAVIEAYKRETKED